MAQPTRRELLGAMAIVGVLPAVAEAAAGAAEAAPSKPVVPPTPPAPGPMPEVTVEVAGRSTRFVPGEDESALDSIRDRLGLRAAKDGCGHGACGACTVHVDGTPMVTCVMPATALDGRRLTTAEELDHPLQRALAAEGAVLCGWCTPGVLMAAIPFVDAWRAARPGERPAPDTVAAALAGNLCRCGAYDAIRRAVTETCVGLDAPATAQPDLDDKLHGRATFTVDVVRPGMLHGAIIRATVARGVVAAVDLAAAEALARVVRPLVAMGEAVRYAGQPLVAVAATDSPTLARACAAVRVDVTAEAAAIGLEGALEGPPVWSERARDAPRRRPSGPNRYGPYREDTGADETTADRRVPEAPVLVATTVETLPRAHAAMEPPAVVAEWDKDTLTVWASTHGVAALAKSLADHFRLPLASVRVRAAHVGGAFGAVVEDDAPAHIAATLARAAGAPVRLVMPRAEAFAVGGHTPHQRVHLQLGTNAMGFLVGMRAETWTSGGTQPATELASLLFSIYPHPAKRLEDWAVTSNDVEARPMAGGSAAVVGLAVESAIDGAARKLMVDPISLRRRLWSDPVRTRLLDAAAESPLWARRGRAAAGRLRRGIGLACGSGGVPVQLGVQVRLRTEGKGFVVECATQDGGDGIADVLAAQVAARFSQVPVRVALGDSSLPLGPRTAGSSAMVSLVPALGAAAASLQDALLSAAAEVGLAGGEAEREGLRHAGRLVPWAELIALVPPQEALGRRRRATGERGSVGPMGHAVVVLEAEVDRWTGRVRVPNVWARLAAAPPGGAAAVRSRVSAAVLRAISHALLEERRQDPQTGRVVTADYDHHPIAGMAECPELELSFEGTDGAPGVEELVAIAVMPALAAAIADAVGVYPTRFPLSPAVLFGSWS